MINVRRRNRVDKHEETDDDASRQVQPDRFNLGGLTAAAAINAGLVAALLFAGPNILPTSPIDVLETTNILIDPPPPEPPKPQPRTEEVVANRPIETIVAPIPVVPIPSTSDREGLA